MLVIIPKRSNRLYYHNYIGGGILSDLTKRLFSSGVKDVINTAAKSAIAQKVTNAVVSGATTEAEKALKNAVTKGVNHLKRKRKPTATYTKSSQSSTATKVEVESIDCSKKKKKPKVNINNLINGSGIIFD